VPAPQPRPRWTRSCGRGPWGFPPDGSPSLTKSQSLTVFLASPRAANITGAEFVIDGGQIKTT
jgi:NAD(P)-dependent dehydrogenase (short-subunit alcohol dehydrogenase family)